MNVTDENKSDLNSVLRLSQKYVESEACDYV